MPASLCCCSLAWRKTSPGAYCPGGSAALFAVAGTVLFPLFCGVLCSLHTLPAFPVWAGQRPCAAACRCVPAGTLTISPPGRRMARKTLTRRAAGIARAAPPRTATYHTTACTCASGRCSIPGVMESLPGGRRWRVCRRTAADVLRLPLNTFGHARTPFSALRAITWGMPLACCRYLKIISAADAGWTGRRGRSMVVSYLRALVAVGSTGSCVLDALSRTSHTAALRCLLAPASGCCASFTLAAGAGASTPRRYRCRPSALPAAARTTLHTTTTYAPGRARFHPLWVKKMVYVLLYVLPYCRGKKAAHGSPCMVGCSPTCHLHRATHRFAVGFGISQARISASHMRMLLSLSPPLPPPAPLYTLLLFLTLPVSLLVVGTHRAFLTTGSARCRIPPPPLRPRLHCGLLRAGTAPPADGRCRLVAYLR